MKSHNHSTKRLNTEGTFFSLNLLHSKKHLLALLLLWGGILAVFTFFGVSNLLLTPLHPLYLVTSLLLLPLIFLMLTITKAYSLFSSFFLFIWQKIDLHRLKHHPEMAEGLRMSSKTFFSITNLIAHFSWLIIFVATVLALFIKFSLQNYDFYLSSTLFPENDTLYFSIINAINAIPSLLGFPTLSESTLFNTLLGTISNQERAEWAKWILVVVTVYGIFPRLLCTLYFLYALLTQKKRTSNQEKEATTIDNAAKKPTISREAKMITTGVNHYDIALDFPQTFYSLPKDLRYLNDLTSFAEYESFLQKSPAQSLSLYLDASQTPDRGTLRRILRLLNYSVTAQIYCIPSQYEINRYVQWDQLLRPLLLDHEEILSSIKETNND